jgi:hypothetical protein
LGEHPDGGCSREGDGSATRVHVLEPGTRARAASEVRLGRGLDRAGEGGRGWQARGAASSPHLVAMLVLEKERLCLVAFGLVVGLCLPVRAMDRWSALSQIESGDNDHAVGPVGEISRYQIKPGLWRHYAATNTDWTNPSKALAVARKAMQERCAAFERTMHRPPTDIEFYILWNAPAQVDRPSKAVLARAERFRNLVNRK